VVNKKDLGNDELGNDLGEGLTTFFSYHTHPYFRVYENQKHPEIDYDKIGTTPANSVELPLDWEGLGFHFCGIFLHHLTKKLIFSTNFFDKKNYY